MGARALRQALGTALRFGRRSAEHIQLALIGLLLVATTFAVRGWQAERGKRVAAEARVETQRQLNDSTAARLASAQRDAKALQGLVKASHDLHGELLAGVRIRLPKRDTLVVHDTLVTTVLADSTRTAAFRDSSFAGVVEGQVVAPPCCQPLGISYTITRPAFAPSVGFVQVGDKQVAVVVWQGERFELEAPYSKLPVAPKRLTYGTEAWVDALGRWEGSADLGVRLFKGLEVRGRVAQRVEPGELPRVQVGVRKVW